MSYRSLSTSSGVRRAAKERMPRQERSAKKKPKRAVLPAIEVVEASTGLPEHIKRELEGLDALKASLAAQGCTFGRKGSSRT